MAATVANVMAWYELFAELLVGLAHEACRIHSTQMRTDADDLPVAQLYRLSLANAVLSGARRRAPWSRPCRRVARWPHDESEQSHMRVAVRC